MPPSSPAQQLPNHLRTALQDRRFFWTIEFVPSADAQLADGLYQVDRFVQELGRRPEVAGFAVTDRVHSDRDPDPVEVARSIRSHTGSQPLVHLAGKDRSSTDLLQRLDAMHAHDLSNVLLLTGDAVKEPPAGRRPRYLESVCALDLARRHYPQLLLGCALSPFKYHEEEAMAQYLKLGLKIEAGADFVITQIGLDINKHEEAIYWMDARGYRVPMVANLMALSAPRARFIRQHKLPGVRIPDSYYQLLEAEEKSLTPDQARARVARRLALQIVGLKMIGYGGVQLTALQSVETLASLKRLVDYYSQHCSDRISWNREWHKALRLPDQRPLQLAPGNGWYLTSGTRARIGLARRMHYQFSALAHRLIFTSGPLAGLLRRLLGGIEKHSRHDRLLSSLERSIKQPLYGCDSCGQCRLALTQYVCPETCPKGLANGACGGTEDNLCEYGHQICIHSVRYRINSSLEQLQQMERGLVHEVPVEHRHSCSWPLYLRQGLPRLRPGSQQHGQSHEV